MITPLLAFGIDAGCPNLILDWCAAGFLPNIARLLERGRWGITSGPEMICEHGIWVSLTSGIPRHRHNYYWFRQLTPGTYKIDPFDARSTGTLPFWHRFAGRPEPVLIFDVPDTQPIPGLAGVQVADWAIHDPQSEPTSIPSSLIQSLGPPIVVREDLQPTLEQDIEAHRQLLARIDWKLHHLLKLIQSGHPHLAFVVFGEAHTGVHQFWRYRNQPGPLQHAIRDIYVRLDSALAQLESSFPTPPNVALIGSVGVHTEWPSEGFLDDFCLKLGYAAKPAHTPPGLIHIARRLLPQSIRTKLSAFLPNSTQGRLLSNKFEASLDWPRTRLFALPYFYMGLLRVNLIGREPLGTVAPGADYDALLDQATEDLLQLRDPVSGEPAVLNVYRTATFAGAPPTHLPDLFVEWQPSSDLRLKLLHPRAELTQPLPNFNRGSEHTRHGLFALAGPAIPAQGNTGPIDPLSIAPTLSSLLPG